MRLGITTSDPNDHQLPFVSQSLTAGWRWHVQMLRGCGLRPGWHKHIQKKRTKHSTASLQIALLRKKSEIRLSFIAEAATGGIYTTWPMLRSHSSAALHRHDSDDRLERSFGHKDLM